jgi:hypothetical protein
MRSILSATKLLNRGALTRCNHCDIVINIPKSLGHNLMNGFLLVHTSYNCIVMLSNGFLIPISSKHVPLSITCKNLVQSNALKQLVNILMLPVLVNSGDISKGSISVPLGVEPGSSNWRNDL